jgi:uncharacterized protein
VTLITLGQVAAAEGGLKGLGFREVRVRHYGDLARIEVGLQEMHRALAERERVVQAVRSAGYRYVTLDLDGVVR